MAMAMLWFRLDIFFIRDALAVFTLPVSFFVVCVGEGIYEGRRIEDKRPKAEVKAFRLVEQSSTVQEEQSSS